MTRSEQFVHDLVRAVPQLQLLYDEHVDDNEALLPHVFMGDVARFAVEKSADPRFRQVLRTLLERLDQGLESDDASIAELVAASFVENLLGEDITELRGVMSPALLQRVELMAGS